MELPPQPTDGLEVSMDLSPCKQHSLNPLAPLAHRHAPLAVADQAAVAASAAGYRSVWEVEGVVANYSAAGLPLEAIWSDVRRMPVRGPVGLRGGRGA